MVSFKQNDVSRDDLISENLDDPAYLDVLPLVFLEHIV
jgi:hypothetical protein